MTAGAGDLLDEEVADLGRQGRQLRGGQPTEVLGPADGTASEAAERCIGVLRRFSEDVTELVRTETADWMVEFRTGPAPLGIQSATGTPRTEGPPLNGRTPLPPGTRPNMPRQRPPEPR